MRTCCVRACVCACVFSSPFSVASLRTRLRSPRTAERASERESAINAWHCHWSSWQRSAPRTTTERSASIVRKCVLRVRARARARTRTHTRASSHLHSQAQTASCDVPRRNSRKTACRGRSMVLANFTMVLIWTRETYTNSRDVRLFLNLLSTFVNCNCNLDDSYFKNT